jgi:hypothetical protein
MGTEKPDLLRRNFLNRQRTLKNYQYWFCVHISRYSLWVSVSDPWHFGADPDPRISTSVLLVTNGSGCRSGKPKNLLILRIRSRIRNTAVKIIFCFQGLLQLPFQPDGTSALCPALLSAEDHALRHTAEFIQVGTSVAQCCGSGYESGSDGSICFWASRIPILLSSNNYSKKNFDSYCFVTSFWLFIFKKMMKIPSKSNKQKTSLKNIFFCYRLEG